MRRLFHRCVAIPQAKAGHSRLQLVRAIRQGRAPTPDRVGPQTVIGAAADDMHMQLRRDIAQGSHIELLHGPARGLAERPHQISGADDLVHEGGSLRGRQLLKLMQAGAAGDQDQPREADVVLKPHLAERPVADRDGARFEGGVGFEVASHAPSVQAVDDAGPVGELAQRRLQGQPGRLDLRL